MKRKRTILGIVAAGLMLTATVESHGVSKIVSSAHNFRQHFQAMRTSSGSLGPVERFVYSLVLANSDASNDGKRITHSDSRI